MLAIHFEIILENEITHSDYSTYMKQNWTNSVLIFVKNQLNKIQFLSEKVKK